VEKTATAEETSIAPTSTEPVEASPVTTPAEAEPTVTVLEAESSSAAPEAEDTENLKSQDTAANNTENLESPVRDAPQPSVISVSPTKSFRSDAEEGIELGEDIIGKCIGGLEEDSQNTLSMDAMAFTLSPMPPPTLQECISPTGVKKFFQAPESNAADVSKAEKIKSILAKLAKEKVQETALLDWQGKIERIFGPAVTRMSSEVEVMRSDMEEGKWYFSKGKILGKAACADTLAVFEWDQASAEELKTMLNELRERDAAESL